MASSTTITPSGKYRKAISSAEYTKDSSFTAQNEKLQLAFERQKIESNIVSLTNRINKILSNNKKENQAKLKENQISEDLKNKLARNIQKKKFFQEIKQKKMKDIQDFKELVQKERTRRMFHIKEREKEIVEENKKIVKKIKNEAVVWDQTVRKQKEIEHEENSKKVQSVKEILDDQAHKRCLSQSMEKERVKNDYQSRVSRLRGDNQQALSALKKLENEYKVVLESLNKAK